MLLRDRPRQTEGLSALKRLKGAAVTMNNLRAYVDASGLGEPVDRRKAQAQISSGFGCPHPQPNPGNDPGSRF